MALKLWIPLVADNGKTLTDYKNRGYYKDNNAAGNYADLAVDSSGNAVYGPYGRCIRTRGLINWADGGIWNCEHGISFGAWFKFDKALSTAYTNNYSIATPLGAFSWSWAGFGLGFTSEDCNGDYKLLACARNNSVLFQHLHNGEGSGPVYTGVWTHIMFSVDIDNDVMYTYINDENGNSTTLSMGGVISSSNIIEYAKGLGLNTNTRSRFTGNADRVYLPFYMLDLRVYDEPLKAGQAKRISRSINSPRIQFKLDGFKASLNIELDCGGYNHNGTIVGTPTYSTDSPRYSQCMVCSGSQYVQVKDPFTNYDELTVSMWFKSTGTGGAIFGNSGESIYAWIYDTTTLSFGWYDSTSASHTLILGHINQNLWYHLVAKKDDTALYVYLNNELILSTTGVTCSNDGTQTISVGLCSHILDKFIGHVSDFRMYSVALSDDEIKKLYEEDAYISHNAYGARELIEETNSNYVVTSNGTTKVAEINEAVEGITDIYSNKLETEELTEY